MQDGLNVKITLMDKENSIYFAVFLGVFIALGIIIGVLSARLLVK